MLNTKIIALSFLKDDFLESLPLTINSGELGLVKTDILLACEYNC